MKLTNTACLAALLLACPLAATAVHGADYNKHYNITPDASGKIASSGYKETPTGSWDNVYIGYALDGAAGSVKGAKLVESSNNVGILGEGLIVKGGEVLGAKAQSLRTANAQANANTLSLKNDVNFAYLPAYSDSYTAAIRIQAWSNAGDANASGNEIHVEGLKQGEKVVVSLYGSSATSYVKAENTTAKANDNTVVVTDAVIEKISVGTAHNIGTVYAG